MIVAVTGANGFVGRRVCAHLARRGHSVRALVRRGDENGERLPAVPGAERSIAWTGVEDEAMLSRACEGADVLLHAAARVHIMRERADPEPEFQRVNVEGTRTACAVAARCGIRRVVFVSTIKVLGDDSTRPLRESEPFRPADAYARSKVEAEKVVRDCGIEWVIVRPPLVYGAEAAGNFRRLMWLARIASRFPLPLGGIDNRRSLVFIENLADAITELASSDGAANAAFHVCDGPALSTSELIRRMARALGGDATLLRCPQSALRSVASALGAGEIAARLLDSLEVDDSRLREVVGWKPPWSMDEALATIGTREPAATPLTRAVRDG